MAPDGKNTLQVTEAASSMVDVVWIVHTGKVQKLSACEAFSVKKWSALAFVQELASQQMGSSNEIQLSSQLLFGRGEEQA